MGLVFIHGVANRLGPDFSAANRTRNAYLREYVYPALGMSEEVEPVDPYWGDLGATFRWNHASVPRGEYEAFGAVDSVDLALAQVLMGEPLVGVNPVTEISRKSPEGAVDLLCHVAAQRLVREEDIRALASFSSKASKHLTNQGSSTLSSASHDKEWLSALVRDLQDAEQPEDLGTEYFGGSGLWRSLSESVVRLQSSAARLTGRIGADVFRYSMHLQAATFIGDVFEYIANRGDQGQPGPIVQRVIYALESIPDGQKIHVLAHSLGGVIAYDVLSYYRPDIRVESLVTCGSQVGFFQELGLLNRHKGVNPEAHSQVESLPNVVRWINILDRNDLLAFSARGIFQGVHDYEYSTGRGLFAAHGSYFSMPSFYKRLATRIGEAT